MNFAQRILILSVRLYQMAVSPLLAGVLGPAARCRFTPSCSQYAAEAVGLHGAVKGSFLAGKRLCRCQPWGGCGVDEVPKLQIPSSKLQRSSKFQVSSSKSESSNSLQGLNFHGS